MQNNSSRREPTGIYEETDLRGGGPHSMGKN